MAPDLPAFEARAPPALTDHLLEEILVRIGAPADLVLASAACKTFRRLITDPTFLHRYRSLHPPLLLGFVEPFTDAFLPVDSPHSNAAAARAFAGAADFSLDHLPDCGPVIWTHRDARDGRVLVTPSYHWRGRILSDVAVCDPLTRGHTLLPLIPDDLRASALVREREDGVKVFESFFDLSSEGYEEEQQFRVMCWTRSSERIAVFVYCLASGSWTLGNSVSWNALGLNVQYLDLPFIGWWANYAYGCFYLQVISCNKLVKLDINSMEFTTVSLPSRDRDVSVVEAGEGRIGMFSLTRGHENCLRYSIRQNESKNANEHPVETTIPLPQEYDIYYFAQRAQGCVFLKGIQKDFRQISALFSLDIKTFKVELLCFTNCTLERMVPYFGFPPIHITKKDLKSCRTRFVSKDVSSSMP